MLMGVISNRMNQIGKYAEMEGAVKHSGEKECTEKRSHHAVDDE
jgi:hypothetical protein